MTWLDVLCFLGGTLGSGLLVIWSRFMEDPAWLGYAWIAAVVALVLSPAGDRIVPPIECGVPVGALAGWILCKSKGV